MLLILCEYGIQQEEADNQKCKCGSFMYGQFCNSVKGIQKLIPLTSDHTNRHIKYTILKLKFVDQRCWNKFP